MNRTARCVSLMRPPLLPQGRSGKGHGCRTMFNTRLLFYQIDNMRGSANALRLLAESLSNRLSSMLSASRGAAMALNAKTDPTYLPSRINGKFAPGYSGNPGGSLEASRRSFNKDFLLALAADFKKHGASAIEKVRKQQPAAYMKICALLVPREMRVEHSGGVKAMTDEQLEQGIEAIRAMLAAREAGENAKVIEGDKAPEAGKKIEA